jgi:hypothetical protein
VSFAIFAAFALSLYDFATAMNSDKFMMGEKPNLCHNPYIARILVNVTVKIFCNARCGINAERENPNDASATMGAAQSGLYLYRRVPCQL